MIIKYEKEAVAKLFHDVSICSPLATYFYNRQQREMVGSRRFRDHFLASVTSLIPQLPVNAKATTWLTGSERRSARARLFTAGAHAICNRIGEDAKNLSEIGRTFTNLKQDITAIDNWVTAALEYAILERANVSLNLGAYNFTTLVPTIAEQVGRDARPEIRLRSHLQNDADAMICDVHLLATVLGNLLYNAMRYEARHPHHIPFARRGK